MKPHVAVLGAGLSGLSTAFHLSRLHPSVRITLVEKQKTSGGWVRSSRVPLPNSLGSVVLEAGPRTLRPNSPSMLELINLLGLKDKVITVSKDSPAAKARYLYIPPDHGISAQGLQQIPSTVIGLLQSPLSRILIPAVAQEALKWKNRGSTVHDESVDSFLRRRLGARFAETFGSAIIHGIYASDSRTISLRSAFPTMWEAEERGFGSLVRGLLIPANKQETGSYDLGDIPELMKDASVYSFRDGMQTLTNALEGNLSRLPNVQLVSSAVDSVSPRPDGFSVELTSGDAISASHVISTLPTPILYNLLPNSLRQEHRSDLSALVANTTSSVHVVNIVFPGPPSTIHPAGFGYLIPRPPSGYPSTASLNDQFGILGTVFDSCSLSAQEASASPGDPFRTSKLTKLTVMIGGPYPLPPLPPHLSSSNPDGSLNTLPPYVQTVLRQLSIHLNRQLPGPIYWRVVPNDQCIPTLSPGHLERVNKLHDSLRSMFGGRLTVAGAGIGGVSMGDCAEGGRKAARSLVLS
ncbi:protoporphyrinogen oxidase [Coprinopsis sp. MPI-PUGE-AT-0042]|nr:protoporphyrinogen oxidase [Coprinopsis sp. MPI-PUGE-AT-0042]